MNRVSSVVTQDGPHCITNASMFRWNSPIFLWIQLTSGCSSLMSPYFLDYFSVTHPAPSSGGGGLTRPPWTCTIISRGGSGPPKDIHHHLGGGGAGGLIWPPPRESDVRLLKQPCQRYLCRRCKCAARIANQSFTAPSRPLDNQVQCIVARRTGGAA